MSEELQQKRHRTDITRRQISETYRHLYYEIIDTVLMQLRTRFNDVDKLHFVSLADVSNFSKYAENFPSEALYSLKNITQTYF